MTFDQGTDLLAAVQQLQVALEYHSFVLRCLGSVLLASLFSLVAMLFLMSFAAFKRGG